MRAGPLLRALLLSAIAATAAGACGDSGGGGDEPTEDEPTVRGLYASTEDLAALADATFFDHPFPSDQRRNPAGKVVTLGWPSGRAGLLATYAQAIDGKLDGFSPVAAGFLRFDGALDASSLPADPGASTQADASVQLIDVDPASPEHGQRRPIRVQFRPDEGVYFPSNLLQFIPAIGFPLRPATRYALVVTTAVRSADGLAVGPADALAEALATEGSALSAVATELEAAGIARDGIAHLAAFTTNDPAAELIAAADSLPAQIEAPTADPGGWEVLDDDPDSWELAGVYGPSPNFQAGVMPFAEYGDGGGFELDASGVPQVQDTFDARFSLSLPSPDRCPMPETGYPLALYAHGTGGDYRSYVFDGTAEALADECVASMGVDQIFHGTRPGAPDDPLAVQVLFFNFQNPDAARTNVRQSTLDELTRERLVTEGGLEVPAAMSPTGAPVRFDPDRLTFFGHSQGALNGTLYLATSEATRGGVLSGASSMITITLLEKTEPSPSIAALVANVLLALKADEVTELDIFHPALALAQTLEDTIDPIHFGAMIAREPRRGGPRSVLITEGIDASGIGDSYSPPRGCEALAMAAGLPLQAPVVWFPPDAAWGGLETVTVPAEGLSGNLANGGASGVLAQWTPPADSDGHFVVFDVPAARLQAAAFVGNLSSEEQGRVPAP